MGITHANRRRRPLAAAMAVAEALERRMLFALFGPDPSFGEGGRAPVAGDIAIDPLPDGKFNAVGTRIIAGTGFDEQPTYITYASRINADGTLDTAFGRNGIVEFGEADDAAYLNARLYLIFEGDHPDFGQVDVIRAFKFDGTPDTSFSGDGEMAVPSVVASNVTEGSIDGRWIVSTPDGGLLVKVEVWANSQNFQQFVKVKANGAVDTSFGTNGFLLFGPNVPEVSVRVTANSVFVIRGSPSSDDVIERYSPDGRTLDDSFGGGDGAVSFEWPYTFHELADRKILLLRGIDHTSAETRREELSRLNADGSLDTTFGTNGKVVLVNEDLTFAHTDQLLTTDPQGRILVIALGRLYRLSANGVLDASPFDGSQPFSPNTPAFDAQGRILTSSFGANVTRFDVLPAVSLGSDGNVYVEGADAADVVTAASAGATTAKVRVTHNGQTTEFDAAKVLGFVMNLAKGDNSVAVSLDLPVTVRSGAGNDTITTAGGNDDIEPGEGSNTLDLGHGNDRVYTNYPGRNDTDHHQITGGNGNKDILISAGHATINLGVGDSKVQTGSGGGDDVINIAGGSNDVQVTGGSDVVKIGGSGNNKVVAILGLGGSFDVTTGDGSDDIILSDPGTVHAGGGDDFIRIQTDHDDGPVTIFCGPGDDKVQPYNFDLYDPNATIYGEDGNDKIWAGHGGQTVHGGAGKDTLYGMSGSDLLSGGGGNDRLVGEGGADRLYGGDGRDKLFDGNGDDRLFGGAAGDWLFSAGGNDQLFGEGGEDRFYADAASSGVSTLRGGAGNDEFNTSDMRPDHLFGDGGRDSAFADPLDILTSIENPA